MKEKMNNIVIFDLEATCWEESRRMNMATDSEIIEIGAVKVDSEFNIVEEFQRFIKPTQHSILSEFCKDLTSIQQNDVDNALTFFDVMEAFEDWSNLNSKNPPLFMSWGDYDRNQVTRECERKKYPGKMVRLVQNHLNLKWKIGRILNARQFGIDSAMKRFNLVFEGTHHRGIDDARNITKIAQLFKDRLF